MSDAVPVTIYTRDDCHLCEGAFAAVERVVAELDVDVTIEAVDVDADPDLREEYGDRVPYVFIDGRPSFKYEVDERELRLKLLGAS